MKRSFVRSLLLALVLACGQAVVAPPALAKDDRRAPTRLWSEYPLNPPGLSGPASEPALAPRAARSPLRPASGARESSQSPSLLVRLVLALFGVSVLFLAAAAAPSSLLPRPLLQLVYRHRLDLALAGATTALSVGVGVAIALIG